MADNNFRSYGSRDGRARAEAPRESASDPLAELARLIGQGDPYAERGSGRSQDHAAAPGFDWAANQDYAEAPAYAEEHDAPPPLPSASYASYARDERDYEAEAPAGGQYFSGPSAKFNGFGADNEAEQLGPVLPPRQFPAFMSPAPANRYQTAAPGHPQEAGEDYGDYADDYYEEPPRPRQRGGLVVMMAVLGLVIVGTAGAFAYRAMFGSVAFPSLPPIIKASIAPNKIVPNSGDAQAEYAKAAAATQAAADKLVSREEQPVSMEPPKVGSRVVATIPIGSGSTPPPLAAAPAPAAAETSTAAFNTASVATPDAAPAAPPPTTASASPPAPSEPKKVRTVVIHSDQSAAAGAQATAPAAAPSPRGARPATSANKVSPGAGAAPVGANAPLSIVPGAEGEAVMPAPMAPAPVASAPSRSRAAATAPIALASAEPAGAVPAGAPSGGGYAVQVTSQRSEADAKASFKELQAKFPGQLSGREPIIRRADLGAKGVYYRALVGPYASVEQAAGACSSIKAAGGNCLVQRN
jgi:hypothetical protein